MKALLALVLSVALAACSKDRAPVADAGVTVDAAPLPKDGHALVTTACLSCHSEEMLQQQRLTPAQWTKVVTKMVGWGANLEPDDAPFLAGWLATHYGPDAGPFELTSVPAAEAASALAPTPDGPFAGGDAERGRVLYMDRCSVCHGADARGKVGVLLIDRPFLYRAAHVAETLRRGRGRMPPMVLADGEIADLLAHLRRLRD